MKKVLIVMLVATAISTTGFGFGNRDLFDTNRTFNKAIIALPNGESIEVDVKQWKDYEDGEQLQVIAKDGTVYLTSSFNCILIKEKEQ